MCIIIDTNKMGTFLRQSEESMPIHKWLNRGAGKIIYSEGGKFFEELTHEMKTNLLEYNRRGEAISFDYKEFKVDQHKLERSHNLESDDSHIIALAKESGARLLYTADNKLKKDFKNRSLIDKPRGKIYSPREHRQQLTRNTCKTP